MFFISDTNIRHTNVKNSLIQQVTIHPLAIAELLETEKLVGL